MTDTPPQPETVPPLALVQPTSFATAVTDGHAPDGTRFVMLRFEHAAGSAVFALPVDYARTLGGQLVEAAEAKPAQGLIIPTVVPPAGL